MMEEPGDGQQSGYSQCTVCCTPPLPPHVPCLRTRLRELEAGDGQADFLCVVGEHLARVLTLFRLVVGLLALSFFSSLGQWMLPRLMSGKPAENLRRFFCFTSRKRQPWLGTGGIPETLKVFELLCGARGEPSSYMLGSD